MRFWGRLIAVMFIVAGATSAFAAPSSSLPVPVRISIALPATIDFSDLDMRDEFNRPIVAPVIRERLEAAMNRELNRLLLENLTPLRRAWLALLDSATDAFGTWLTKAAKRAQQAASAILPTKTLSVALGGWRSAVRLAVPALAAVTVDSPSLALSLRSISSTRLLR